MKKTVTFEFYSDDVRKAIAMAILKDNASVKFDPSEIKFIDGSGLAVPNVSATVTAIEEEKKRGAVSKKQVQSNSPGPIDAGSSGPSS